jgi:hypothetical protein
MNKVIAVLLCCLTSLAHAVGAANKEYCKVDFVIGKSYGVYKGECLNGAPDGDGYIEFYNGDVLHGHFNEGVLSGNVMLKTANGSEYRGTMVDGKRHGEGSYQWAMGASYVGEWVDDMRHGEGTYTWTDGSRFEGEFKENKRFNGTYYSANGRVMRCRMGQCR